MSHADPDTSSWLLPTLVALRAELLALRPRLAARVAALRGGSLERGGVIWLNTAAACPVPSCVIEALTRALAEPHVTLERGADAHTQALKELWQTQVDGFCSRYAAGHGTLLLGYNATHVLLALGRALLNDQAIVHGALDHKASYALSSLPGWRERVLVPYSDAGFYDRHTLTSLPEGSVFLFNVLHHMYGTLQADALAHVPASLQIVLDLSQAMSTLPAAQLAQFMRRADAAVWNLGKAFSPSSIGVLWLRDPGLAQRVLTLNPELAGSVSSLTVKTLASASSYLYGAVDDDWHAYIRALTRYTLARLAELDHVSLIGCRSFEANTHRLSIVSLTVHGMTPQELGIYLDGQGFAVRADGNCTRADEASSPSVCVRISLLPHITPEDIDALTDALRACA